MTQKISNSDIKLMAYAVDSGTIGCVLLTNPKHRAEAQRVQSRKLGHIIRFGSSFRTHEAGGHIFIGDVEIDTKEDTDWNPNYEDEEEDDE